jgi:hypothetical protein
VLQVTCVTARTSLLCARFISYKFIYWAVCGLRWSSAGLWYPRSWVRTQPKLSDFLGEKIHSTPSFRGEVKLRVPCRRFAACKRSLWFTWKSEFRAKLTGHFLPIIPSFTNRGLSCRLTWSGFGDDGRNWRRCTEGLQLIGLGVSGW